MVKKELFFAIFPVVLIIWLSNCATLTREKIVVEPRVSSYIRTWPIPEGVREGDNPYWTANMIKGEYLTDLMIAFALIDPKDGTSIFIPEYPEFDVWAEVAALKEKYPHLRVSFSVGGGSLEGLAGFSKMAANPAMRATFADNICAWLEDYNLDGVDVDWEYPVGAEWDDYHYPQDRKNYILLLKDIREATNRLGEKTGKRYLLSSAVPASWWFVQRNDARAAAKIVDYLKLMCYDYYGPWSKTSGHNANLYNNPADPAWGGWSTNQGLDVYFKDWIPMEKIMLGVAFYGRGWTGVEPGPNPETPGLFMPYKTSKAFNPDGALAYSEIKELLKPGSGFTRYWDDIGKAPWLYNGDIMLSYTDEQLIKLITDYAKEKKVGGVFVWEFGHDLDADLMKVLYENMQ
ncbi:MAG: glycosyl hydrolase family 18 protein [Treponema sp.]|nr:glycosyl hydrolase family 18 protein [Treponema sp.]